MTKTEFVLELSGRLDFLPQEEALERIDFYLEIIEDRMDQGLSEEDAVREAGSIDEIVSQILEETPLSRLVSKKLKPKKRFGVLSIIFLILGSPIWLSLLIAAFAVGFSLYVSLWSVILSLWAVFGSVIVTGFAGILCGIIFVSLGKTLSGIALIGAGAVCTGLSVFLFFGCRAATKGAAVMTKKLMHWLKRCLTRKENV